ncbi:MAG: IclR family transcriptional regulator [Acidimicrobiales bacterium]|nr:IclR family transcriptional regulator [Acidimicrobiales bacterium]
MARPSPAVERTTAILDFLAAHPNEPWTLSELARRLDLNKATAHALLSALTDAGYLVRHPIRKDYALGPALIGVGRAALAQFPVVDFARPEMRRLAADTGLECLATASVDGDMVILEQVGTPRPLTVSVAVGQRVPIAPPFGTAFVAWETPVEVERWLARSGSPVSDTERARYDAALAAVRERGYSVTLDADAHARFTRATATGDGGVASRDEVGALVDELGHQDYLLIDLDPDETYRVNHVAAPVFDADGHVTVLLALIGFRGRVTGAEVAALAERLVAGATAVTQSVHGRVPAA